MKNLGCFQKIFVLTEDGRTVNDMRLIDADAFEEKLKTYLGGQAIGFLLVGALRNEPTIDAVPVVRCKDCKHHHYICMSNFLDRSDNDFCSYGERKDGDTDGS